MPQSFALALMAIATATLSTVTGCASQIPPAFDHNALEAALGETIPAVMAKGDIPGAVILVGKRSGNGFDVWTKAYGHKQIKPTVEPMTVDAVFDLASMTKPIATGTSLMVLVDQGKVRIEDAVVKYLSEYREGQKKNVTVHQLMTHMSGLKPYVHAGEQKKIKDVAGFPCPDELRKYIRELELSRNPGEVKVYSCLNAITCAEIVRKVTGQEISEFASENVFARLGMKDSGYNPPARLWSRTVPTTQTDYGRGEDGFLLGQVHDPLAAMQGGISGNAGLFSTAQDLSLFAQMMLNKGQLNGKRILKAETVEQMTKVQNPGIKNTDGVEDRRGLLWDIYQPNPGDKGIDTVYAYGHTGYTGTAIRIYPDKDLYIIALTNRVHPDDSGRVGGFRSTVWNTVGRVVLGLSAN